MSSAAGIDALCTRLESYLTPDQIADIRRAYLFSENAHEGQFRRNGSPYITHPLAVANILCDMHMDHQSIMAAMLHDVIEDTGVTKGEIAELFSPEVADLVDGVTKLTQVHFTSKAEAQAENFRKMMLAMTQDIRVILVKLADRLHNMRTLDVLTPEKRRRVATETLDIYAPIANRLGMNDFRVEFEDLGFYALFPMRAPLIRKAVMAARGNRKEMLVSIKEALEARMSEEGVKVRVIGREKHLYSIYQKMREKQKSFSEIMDVYGFRVITENVDACYRALGIAHNLYKPIPGKFKDYIAIPKANGYQSLHTILKGQRGVPVEIQIRTEAMEAMANNGIAAHWLYKSDGFTNTSQTRAREWMKSLLEIQKNAGDSMEFIENVKIDLFPDEVYVFTPKGRSLTLPVGATAVDFAYAVHTGVGNTCVAARVDNRLAPLSLPLFTGQTVEIITAPGARPNPAWLNFVITSKARSSIRHFLKDQQQSEAVDLGRRLLEKTLSTQGSGLAKLAPERIASVLNDLGLPDIDALCEEIGIGNRVPQIVAARLLPDDDGSDTRGATGGANANPSARSIAIRGTEGLVITYARCCRPLPGDPIVGHLSAGRGIVIHRDSCNNILAELRDSPDKCMNLRWSEKVDREFQSELRIELVNQRGLLAEIARQVTEMDANIEGINIQEKGAHHGVMHLSLQVHNRIHLARLIKRIRIIKGVEKITRVRA
ncbi:MAG: bifunctional GTP diphosphokinase/guanosine-3',5'-bis pyrophosphate 3'-pyrophosphohydrolase [Moraxellaceae bacterium]|nr:bifunctional GTP diphosphokinase/guanosine-3',5'-bis pyrophosphate 3'-pyrophosphohydrolase [Moraxellaceae bacterium]